MFERLSTTCKQQSKTSTRNPVPSPASRSCSSNKSPLFFVSWAYLCDKHLPLWRRENAWICPLWPLPSRERAYDSACPMARLIGESPSYHSLKKSKTLISPPDAPTEVRTPPMGDRHRSVVRDARYPGTRCMCLMDRGAGRYANLGK